MTYDDFRTRVETARANGLSRLVVPVHARRSADLLTPVSAYLALRRDSPFSFLFESVEGGGKLARYSFLGRDPYRILTGQAFGATVEVDERRTPSPEAGLPTPTGPIFAVMDAYPVSYTHLTLPTKRTAQTSAGCVPVKTTNLHTTRSKTTPTLAT